MTARTLRSVQLQDWGPRVRVRIEELPTDEEPGRSGQLAQESREDLVALVDTGASFTFLPPGGLARLGLQPTDETWVRSAGIERSQHPSTVGMLLFPVPGGSVNLPSRVVEVPGIAGVEAIVGRDTLGHGRFLYEGREGACALVLRGVEVPMVDPAPA